MAKTAELEKLLEQVAEQATKSGSLVRFVLGAAVAAVVCALILVAL